MNRLHNLICSSRWWARGVERELVPWGLADVDLGDDVLEIGPGFGATTEALAKRGLPLTVLELEPDYCRRLSGRLDGRAEVVCGDATEMPFEDGRFSAAVCFTMLHHVPSAELQDRLFSEALRVLRPGGTFAGTDSTGRGVGFALLHVGDVRNVLDPRELPGRLEAAGFERATVDWNADTIRFRAS